MVDHRAEAGGRGLDHVAPFGDGLEACRRDLLGRHLAGEVGRGVGGVDEQLGAGAASATSPRRGVEDLVGHERPERSHRGVQHAVAMARDGVERDAREVGEVLEEPPVGDVLAEGHTVDLLVARHQLARRARRRRSRCESSGPTPSRSPPRGAWRAALSARAPSCRSIGVPSMRVSSDTTSSGHTTSVGARPCRAPAISFAGRELGGGHGGGVDLGLAQAPHPPALHRGHPDGCRRAARRRAPPPPTWPRRPRRPGPHPGERATQRRPAPAGADGRRSTRPTSADGRRHDGQPAPPSQTRPRATAARRAGPLRPAGSTPGPGRRHPWAGPRRATSIATPR